jgi:hypothetical protein
MSDISISFPLWVIAWFLLGEATPFSTLALMSLAAAFFFSRGTGHDPSRTLAEMDFRDRGRIMARRDQLLGCRSR